MDIGKYLNLEPEGRRDQHSLTQNIASMLNTLISKLMGPQIKVKYKAYLLKNGIRNSQMIFLFAYLFLSRQSASAKVYSDFKSDAIAYLHSKLRQKQWRTQKIIEAVSTKINANIEILNYLFGRERGGIDWEEMRRLGEVLFRGKQKGRINSSLEKGRRIEEDALGITSIEKHLTYQSNNSNDI